MRAAIVGTGYIARVHARLIRELGGEVAAVVGRSLGSAQGFGAGNAYGDMAAMLRAERPEVVHVCTPNALHCEQAIAAFRAGAHVLCEKPMATSGEECARMIEAAGRAGRVGAIAYCYRGYPLVRELRARVAAGDFGELWRVSGAYLSQDVFDPEKYVWHFTPGGSGPSFALFDLGVHWLDLAGYVAGAPVTEVSADFATRRPTRTWRGGEGQGPRPPGGGSADAVPVEVAIEDHAELTVRFAGGASGSATVMALSPGNPNALSLSVDGSEGGFDWQQEEPSHFVERRLGTRIRRERDPARLAPADRWMAVTPAGHPDGYHDAFRNVIAESWHAMREGGDAYPSFPDGARGIATVEAAIRSARLRRPEPVAPPAGS